MNRDRHRLIDTSINWLDNLEDAQHLARTNRSAILIDISKDP